MTDIELLELAAKAAGIDGVYQLWEDGRGQVSCGIAPNGSPGRDWWNPLRDDGAALRLAVRLGLDLMRTEADVEAIAGLMPYVKIDAHTVSAPFAVEPLGADPAAATRRAIVRAAAEMGRSAQ